MSPLESTQLNLGDVQSTLLLPLVGRAKATEMATLDFVDEMATQIVSTLRDQLEPHFRAVDLYSTLCYASRAMKMASALEEFTKHRPGASVVNIGAGLDTIFYRIDNGHLRWYDLDLPDVVALRRKLLPEGPRNTCIAKSLFDAAWYDDVATGSDGVFMIAGGVLMYYPEPVVREFLRSAAERFPGAELLFDVLSNDAVRSMNAAIAESDGKNVAIQWGIDDCAEMCAWSSRIRVLGQTPYFGHVAKHAEWGDSVLNEIRETDERKVSSFIHLRFEP